MFHVPIVYLFTPACLGIIPKVLNQAVVHKYLIYHSACSTTNIVLDLKSDWLFIHVNYAIMQMCSLELSKVILNNNILR